MELKEFLEKGREVYLPNLSIDLVIIGYHQQDLKCLLLKTEGKWVLPGGYIKKEESVEKAAKRILRERTNLGDPHLKFLSVFGDRDRHFVDDFKEFFKRSNLPWKEDYWINNRFVSLTYYSLVDIKKTKPSVKRFDEAFDWFSFDELPDMWLDHKEIVEAARERLKDDIRREHVSYNLLPDPFTMPELHQLHQTILGEKIDRSRFQKKMLSTGLFERLPKRKKESPGRNPYQYTVKVEQH